MSKIVKIEDFLSKYGDGIHGTPMYDDSGEYYFVNGNNLRNGEIVIDVSTPRISNEEYNRIKRPLDENSLLLSINGTLGNIAEYHNEKIALGKSACYLNFKDKDSKDFIKYVLSTKRFSKYMQNVAHGSTIKNLAPEQVAEYEFECPDEKDRKKITELLDILCQKIRINQSIIVHIESLAKTIYDDWFLQFDFPDENGNPYKSSSGKMIWNEELKREIPDGWKCGTLSKIASIVMGSSPFGETLNESNIGTPFYQGSTDFGDIYPSERVYTTDPKRFAEMDSILFSVRAPVGDINISLQRCCIGRGVASLSSCENGYLFNLLKSLKPFFEPYNNTGTTFGDINHDSLSEIKIVLPPKQVREEFENIVRPFFEKMKKLFYEIKELENLRDFLLPMLMNGQVSIKD